MSELANGCAVITGGASGIGLALAKIAAERGMGLALLDIDDSALERARKSFEDAGVECLAIVTDVANHDSVSAAADAVYERFGSVSLLFNNAGVGGCPITAATMDDWIWTMSVNLHGVIHGIDAFLPRMLKQNAPSRIVNTASIAGLITTPVIGTYHVSKFAVVGLSESLAAELEVMQANVGVSVVCPGWVKTDIKQSERHRPAELGSFGKVHPRLQAARRMLDEAMNTAMEPEECAIRIFDGIDKGKLHILTHPDYDAAVRERVELILSR